MGQLKWVLGFWRPYKIKAILIVILTFVYGGFAICYPLIFKYIIDSLNQGLSNSNIIKFVLILFACGICTALAYMYLQRNRLTMNLTLERDIRNRTFGLLSRFGSKFYQKFPTGDIVTRLMDELEQLCHLCSSGIFRFLQIWITIIFTVAVLIALSLKLTLLSTVPLLLVFVFYMSQDQNFFAKNKAMRDAVSEVNNAIETCFSGINVVKSYCIEGEQEQYFGEVMQVRKEREIELLKLEQKMQFLYGAMSQVGMFVIVLYGGFMVLNKEITLGSFVAFSNYIMVLAGPLMEIGWFLSSFRKGFVTVNRLIEIEREMPQIVEADVPAAPDFNCGNGKCLLEFKNVGFNYGEAFALKDIVMTVEKGRKIAIVGGFGSGKTTLLSMVMRFNDPVSGEVRLSGENLKKLSLKGIRENTGYVPQDCYLFSGTILENISFGREYSADELDRALETAQLKDTLTTFRRGLDEEIGIRGLSLSGGQKQRVSIARAILKSPEILILDDATSSLDNKTEDNFWSLIKRNYDKTTVLFTSHRVNTIKYADKIYVLDKGKIADSGSFDHLMQNSMIFKKLIQKKDED